MARGWVGIPQGLQAGNGDNDADSISSASSASLEDEDDDDVYVAPKKASDWKGVGAEWKKVPNSAFCLSDEEQFGGSFEWVLAAKDGSDGGKECKGKEEEFHGSIAQGLQKLKHNPQKYVYLLYPTGHKQTYSLIHRKGTMGWPRNVKPPGEMGKWTLYTQDYHALPRFPNNEYPLEHRDAYTDSMTFRKQVLHTSDKKPLLPGRGMGCCDTPLIKIIGDVDPSDIYQGSVGDCWMLSAISALAEFDGAVKRLFRKTTRLDERPLRDGSPNTYVVTLWDLTTWTEKDIVLDERLAASHDVGSKQVLAAKPSTDGELWTCYLEKALAIHCGGWDRIVGGNCNHAWALLTGCRHQYHITNKYSGSGKYQCLGKYNPHERKWEPQYNCFHDNEQVHWEMEWPQVGGGGELGLELTADELFLKMVAWDKQNYIVGAGCSNAGADGGLVADHAYSVLESHANIAGSGIDLCKVRNPWGKGEIKDGQFDDDGPGWDQYPEVKKAMKPVVADDGIFYVTKKEFFKFFSSLYLSASDMTEFLED
mmetsp:Transcript_18762/g.38851  ORF Transcript_18762/g.38851 Transcript_18762/m.38851 type:complete len:536 (-) Transcript_18762:355-1962(-)|eukprot:CAMPEP_0172439182 /NCGR_PEP_ID=MMETSP1065-20121228/248_1 /TAXON_ID=265537 /ORGANISM="Amphiprora paludosa, Strain CCMP125" /LENGTH=535 /DNA_ID=CAMNT_0013187829 /DNA_START=39 /DNA_END=1646 /DNA_ORIENTATION=+